MISLNRRGLSYQLLLWFSLAGSLMLLLYLSPQLVRPENILVDDFSQFWAAGKLNVSGGNPYNPEEITRVIHDIGGKVASGDVVSIMLNPPWTLTFVMPFALVTYPISRLIWLLLNISLVITSIKLLWDIFGGELKHRKYVLLLLFLFSPVLSAIQKGQFTPIILFGITLAVYNIKKSENYWAAGIFLSLASLKPQLIYLVWIGIIIWSLGKNKWQLFVSTLSTIAILTMIPLIINPNLLDQYIHSMTEYPFSAWATPTIGSLLRLIFGIDKFWLQFLPMAIGSIIYGFYLFMQKETWSWLNGIPMLVALSLLTTAYAWTYDALLFIIPIVYGLVYAIHHYNKKFQWIIFSSLFLISLLNIGLHTRLNDFWFMWLFPSLFLWYLITINGAMNSIFNKNGSYG